ncbi:MAG: PAS domain S-box protein, partial [Sandaracinaceae bacterium]
GPIREGGAITGFIVIASDVTERTSAAIQRDRVFELAKDLLCVVDLEGRFLRVSPAFVETLGYAEEELIARPLLELVHPEDREATEAVFAHAKESEVTVFENRYVCQDGSVRVLQWTSRPDPLLKQIVAVARDVTEQRELEARLQQAQKMDAVGQLAGGVAHDFNNLVQAILGNVHFALSAGPSGEMQEYLQDIESAANRAAELTRQLLTYSRQQPLSVSRVDFNVMVRELLLLLRRVIPESIEVVFDGSDALDPVEVDRSQLEQVLMNLCLNARDAMPSGGRLTIETESVTVDEAFSRTHPTVRPGRFLRVAVSDTGVGMSAAVRRRVFEPFFTTKPLGEGNGLGLSMAYGIVQRHGGIIDVSSEPGKGATFELYLPVSRHPVTPVEPKNEVQSEGGGETILVAEDESMVRRVVVRVLERAGYRVLESGSGLEAIEVFEAHPEVDLLLLDVVMPTLSGPEALERMRAIRPGVPAVFSSGYSDGGRFAHAIPEGTTMVAKPFKADALLGAIREALDARP